MEYFNFIYKCDSSPSHVLLGEGWQVFTEMDSMDVSQVSFNNDPSWGQKIILSWMKRNNTHVLHSTSKIGEPGSPKRKATNWCWKEIQARQWFAVFENPLVSKNTGSSWHKHHIHFCALVQNNFIWNKRQINEIISIPKDLLASMVFWEWPNFLGNFESCLSDG